jgi:hypothetical protein
VAEYSASTGYVITPRKLGPTTLYLTSPLGRRYAIRSWPGSYQARLLDWSGDRQRVLVDVAGFTEQVSLATGAVISKFKLPRNVYLIGYTRPDGLNLLAARSVSASAWQVVRYNLTGRLQKVLVTVKGPASAPPSVIGSPDGKSLIVAAGRGLEQVSNTGGVIRRLIPPPAVSNCYPVRWWNLRTVLAFCFAKRVHGARLLLFPVGGGKAISLTPLTNAQGYGSDLAAWKLSARLYVQTRAPAGCSMEIGQLFRDGTVHAIQVPGGASTTNQIDTGFGRRLLVESADGACNSTSLLWFDPFTHIVKYVLRAPASIAGVQAVVPFGRPLTS